MQCNVTHATDTPPGSRISSPSSWKLVPFQNRFCGSFAGSEEEKPEDLLHELQTETFQASKCSGKPPGLEGLGWEGCKFGFF